MNGQAQLSLNLVSGIDTTVKLLVSTHIKNLKRITLFVSHTNLTQKRPTVTAPSLQII